MPMYQLFPFEYVNKGSRVIIYGLGTFGQSYIEQIKATKWCKVVGISDTDCRKKIPDYPFYKVDRITSIKADYVIIAIAAIEMVNQVYWKLIECGIPESKIVSTLDRTQQDYKYTVIKIAKGNNLRILFRLGGGLGDYVVYLSVYEKFISMLPNVEIDVKCRITYGKAVFAHKKYVCSIIDEDATIDYDYYDLALHLEHGIQILKYDEERCGEFSLAFSEKIQLLKDSFEDMNKDILNVQYCFGFYIRRACVKGWNRYRALGNGDILDLNAEMVHVDLQKSYLSEYAKLQLKQYITINRGADKLPTHRKSQVKVWPLKYYEQLIPMLKKKYPQYEIVQLGSDDTEEIRGVDRYIKGQDLELVKYILKESCLHLDCEGGLVHLATALRTKCAVLFGPTPMEYYAYPQNINITAGKCHSCMCLLKDWYVECLRGEDDPECMYGITPEMVFEKISNYLDWKESAEEKR